jgi:hypothetical protein
MENVAGDPAVLTAVETTIPKDREFVLKRPGNINWASERGSFAGSRAIVFTRVGALGLESDDAEKFTVQMSETVGAGSPAANANLYFKHRANLLVVNYHVDVQGDIHCLITNHLENDELEEFQEYQNAMAVHMREWHQKREDAKRKREEAEEKEAKEHDDLLLMGKKAVEHNLFSKLRELEEKVKELNNALKKAKKGKGD